MFDLKERFSLTLQGKIFATISLACIAIVLSYKIANIAFKDMQYTVAKIVPNRKLVIANNLFINILQLDNLQKAQALREKDDSNKIIDQKIFEIRTTLDTLRNLSLEDPIQVQRIDSMQRILIFRDSLFKNYIQIRSDLSNNKVLFNQINTLYSIISATSTHKSGIKTTETIITTTTKVVPTEESEGKPKDEEKPAKKSFFERLFGSSKKNEPVNDLITKVDEEQKVTVDTITVTNDDYLIKEVETIVKKIEQGQKERTSELLNKEFDLINYSNILLTNVLNLLNEIEQKEIYKVNADNAYISDVVNTSMNRINLIMYFFFFTVAILALFILFDISKSRRHRNELLQAKEEAEHHSQAKQRFLSNISHELRTPLQSILGYAEQVQQQENPDRKQLEAIHKSADHLLQIVNEVLDYSRIISGKFSFNIKPFNIRDLISETIEIIKFQAEAKNLHLQVNIDLNKHYWYLGDGFRLKQILFNLLGNAIKFTNEGSVGLNISSLDMEGKKTSFLFEVWDTGIGISKDNIDKVFKDFEQEDKFITSNFGGTGLGLNIVKALVEAQEGSIQVESQKAKGSKFIFNLLYEKTEAPQQTRAKEINFKDLSIKGKVVVVDDDPFILQLCKSILNKHHIPNFSTSSPLSILKEEWDEDIKLVFTDIRMPDMNGFEFCEEIRIRTNNCAVIALTAQALPEELDNIMQKGFDAVLMKPFKEKELLGLIASYLNNQQIEKEEEGPELDLSTITRMLKGNEEMLIEILHQYLFETQSDLENLKIHLEEQDPKPILNIMHKLAGRIGQIGGTFLSTQLRRIEINLVNGNPLSDYNVKINELTKEINKLNEKIEKEIAERVKLF